VRVAVEHGVVVALILFLSSVTLAGVIASATSSSIIGVGALVVVAELNEIAPAARRPPKGDGQGCHHRVGMVARFDGEK
jgi:hypothetical protein